MNTGLFHFDSLPTFRPSDSVHTMALAARHPIGNAFANGNPG